jgi:uncharacterized protein YcbK (DUF882 family)
MTAAATPTQEALANGDTRSLTFFHTHTKESATITFRRNGKYDEQALAQLNWLLRDWRVDKPAQMDPHLFDILWEVYRESGSAQPINIISAYRSPETNGALRRRSSGVAEHSQHMLGKAMDIRLPDVDTAQLRAVAMRMQYGGVGYYPSSAFVHIDTGNVRAWPRMSQQQLARLFPDGKTVHLPSSGKPLAGYEQAKAEILPRNAALAAQASAGGGSIGNLIANIFRRKTPAQPPQMDNPAGVRTALAYAATEDAEPVQVLPPMPPPRPQEKLALIEASIASDPAPAEALKEASASLPEIAPALEPILGIDEKAALRALFDPRTAFLDLGFSSQARNELSTTYFRGAAVKPVPRLRQARVNLWAEASGQP